MQIKSIASLVIKYSRAYIFYFILLAILWLAPQFQNKMDKDLINFSKEKIEEISEIVAKRDINSYFQKLAFTRLHTHVIKNPNIITNEPISILLEKNNDKNSLYYLNEVKKIVKNFNNKKFLKTIYVFPLNSKHYMYKIDVQKLQVYFMSNKKVDLLNESQDFIKLELISRIMFFPKKQLLKDYQNNFLEIMNFSKDLDTEISNQYLNRIESYYFNFKILVTILLTFTLVLYYFNKVTYEEMLLHKSSNADIYYSQHDVKTNSLAITNRLYFLYSNLKDNVSPNILFRLIEVFALEKTIALANDYAKSETAKNQYSFKNDFKSESIIQYFDEDIDITNDIKQHLIDFNISIENIDNYVVRKSREQLYENELSSALFRLLNNAIKHRKRNTKIKFNITTNENRKLYIEIINETIDSEENIQEKIKTSLNSSGNHNLTTVQKILEKYKLYLNTKHQDGKLISIIQEKEIQ